MADTQKVALLQEQKKAAAAAGLKPWSLDKFAPQADLAPVATFYDGPHVTIAVAVIIVLA